MLWILHTKCCLNPLKSGHMYWIKKLFNRAAAKKVLIPLNRVICIEYNDFVVYDDKFSLNPLKSGHMYWILNQRIIEVDDLVLIPLNRVICIEYVKWLVFWQEWLVLIPLNRVICIESVEELKGLNTLEQVLIPLNRVICIELKIDNKTSGCGCCLNPLKSGHMYWIFL